MEKFLEKFQKYTLYAFLVLYPVFVLSNYTTPYIVPKEILLAVGVSLLVVLWVAKMIIKGSFVFSVGKFDLGVLLLALAYLLSGILATPNKMEAFFLPGTATFVIGGAVLYFLINQFDKKTKEGAGMALLSGALLLSLSILLSSLGLFAKIPQLPVFVKDSTFNPIGGSFPAGIFLTSVLVYILASVVKETETVRKLFFGVSSAIMLFGLVVMIGQSLPGKPLEPKLPSMQTSWEVTVDSLKQNPLWGVGPSNYLTAFNLFKPVSYNQTDIWALRFTTATNYYFTHITEVGFAGLLAMGVLLISVFKLFSKEPTTNLKKYSLAVLLVVFIFLPASPILMVLLFTLLAFFSLSEGKSVRLNVLGSDSSNVSSRLPALIVGLPFIAGVVALSIFGSKVLAAEATYKKSLDALTKNEAKNTFDLMQAAVNLNPQVDRYHAGLAQVDMALAQSIASKEEVTEEDRTTITQLVQQAINEGKATVSLNISRSGNWEILAQIYRAIMPFATGADQFAIQTYTQAVVLDPSNPNLRIALGGVYYALGRYDEAVEAFKLAAVAKPDLANAHYNLAVTYREKKDFDNAIASMNNVLSLVDPESQDYQLAKGVLEELEKSRPAITDAEGTENLTPPQPVEDSNVKPPIELPDEATPPATTP